MKRNVHRFSTRLASLHRDSAALVSPGTISRLGGRIVLLALGAVFSVNLLQAQSSAVRGLQPGSLTPGNLAGMVAIVAQTTPSPPESIPRNAALYSAQNPQWPPFPANINNLPAWNLGGNVWMLADLDFDYQAQAEAYAMARAMDDGPPPLPGGGGGGGGSGSGGGGSTSPSYTTNDLWHEGKHTPTTLQAGIDFYYGLGALVNFYSHQLSDPSLPRPPDVTLEPADYIAYCSDATKHPNLWSANARSIYQWWLKRSAAQIVANYSVSGGQYTTSINVAGAQDDNTAIEVLVPATGVVHSGTLQVTLDGLPAPLASLRQVGNIVRVKVGTSTHNATISYNLNPVAHDDGYYVAVAGAYREVPDTQGVLQNDTSPRGGTLTATLVTPPALGTFTLHTYGGLTWQAPATEGTYTFTYKANDGTSDSAPATGTILVVPAGAGGYLVEDFSASGGLPPGWTVHSGTWNQAAGVWTAGPENADFTYGTAYYPAGSGWTASYSVQARVRFQAGAYGGGIAGHVNPATGARYGLWLYPEDSASGNPPTLALVKFWDWGDFGYNGTEYALMHDPVPLQSVGSDWHTLKLAFLQNGQIAAYFDSQLQFSMADTDTDLNHPPYGSGGVSLDMWTDHPSSAYTMSADYVVVQP